MGIDGEAQTKPTENIEVGWLWGTTCRVIMLPTSHPHTHMMSVSKAA